MTTGTVPPLSPEEEARLRKRHGPSGSCPDWIIGGDGPGSLAEPCIEWRLLVSLDAARTPRETPDPEPEHNHAENEMGRHMTCPACVTETPLTPTGTEPKMVCVELHGGPKDGWTYEMPLHWEKAETGPGIVWMPPDTIEAGSGAYRLPEKVSALGRDRIAAAVARAHHVAYEWTEASRD